MKFNVLALANTFAVIDLVLHPLFHLWVSINSDSYEWLMGLFVAGLRLEVTYFDLSIFYIIVGIILEAAVFWVLGASVALIYNKFSKSDKIGSNSV